MEAIGAGGAHLEAKMAGFGAIQGAGLAMMQAAQTVVVDGAPVQMPNLIGVATILFGSGGVAWALGRWIARQLEVRREEERLEREQQRADQKAQLDDLRRQIDVWRGDWDQRDQRTRAHYDSELAREKESCERAYRLLAEERARNEAYVKLLWERHPESAADTRREYMARGGDAERPGKAGGGEGRS